MCPSVIFSPRFTVRTGAGFSPESAQEDRKVAAAATASNSKNLSWRMWLNYCPHAVGYVSIHPVPPGSSIQAGDAAPGLLGLAFLKDALELPALLLVEYLFHLGFAVAQHGAVVLPEVVEDGFHLLLLSRREIQFTLHPREIQFPA